MNHHNHEHGLEKTSRIPRADAGKHAFSAQFWVKPIPACPICVVKERDSAPQFSIPSAFDGLPCAFPPGADLAGGAFVVHSQPLSFQSGDHFPNQFASCFPGQMSFLPRGVQP